MNEQERKRRGRPASQKILNTRAPADEAAKAATEDADAQVDLKSTKPAWAWDTRTKVKQIDGVRRRVKGKRSAVMTNILDKKLFASLRGAMGLHRSVLAALVLKLLAEEEGRPLSDSDRALRDAVNLRISKDAATGGRRRPANTIQTRIKSNMEASRKIEQLAAVPPEIHYDFALEALRKMGFNISESTLRRLVRAKRSSTRSR